jgi:hypothetical protein
MSSIREVKRLDFKLNNYYTYITGCMYNEKNKRRSGTNKREYISSQFKEDNELRMMEELLMFSSEAKRFIGLYTSHNKKYL